MLSSPFLQALVNLLRKKGLHKKGALESWKKALEDKFLE
jgi:hypothetical protein